VRSPPLFPLDHVFLDDHPFFFSYSPNSQNPSQSSQRPSLNYSGLKLLPFLVPIRRDSTTSPDVPQVHGLFPLHWKTSVTIFSVNLGKTVGFRQLLFLFYRFQPPLLRADYREPPSVLGGEFFSRKPFFLISGIPFFHFLCFLSCIIGICFLLLMKYATDVSPF